MLLGGYRRAVYFPAKAGSNDGIKSADSEWTTMQLTYLGHAGFCVETAGALIIMDPWLSPEGAFDSAWFQFPRNHHLASLVHKKLSDSSKECFLYVSHEHHDHFDPEFLSRLPCKNFTFVVPRFQRAALRSAVAGYGARAVIASGHGETVPIPGGHLKLYLDDSGLNRDSAILLKADDQCFLNFNDCKLYDQLPAIVQDQGPISVFASQFSGATWHPTCYDYAPEEYERISQHKLMSKFEMVARAIETSRARFYLPSAGPPCFLDPTLMHLNFERINIFPRAPKFLEFLRPRLADSPTLPVGINPGDVLEVDSGRLDAKSGERVNEENLREYLESYAAQYSGFFADRQCRSLEEGAHSILERLRVQLERKLSAFTLHHKIRVPLYFSLSDFQTSMVRIDFPARAVEIVSGIRESEYYSLSTPSWQIARVLDGAITWEDFALTFRMRLNRRPDVYQTLIQGFLLMEPEDMNWFCARLLEIEGRQKRVIVEAGGTRYSIDRFCPHQGGDLSQGWPEQDRLWTCPRHRWQFALDKEGQCLTSNASIHAVCLENE